MQERQWFAMAAIGRDRPGIVADLSECVFACGCNLEDASMTMLGNEFSTLMLVSGTGENLRDRLYESTKRLEWECSLTVLVRPLDGEPPAPAVAPAPEEHSLEAIGVDRAGIVAGVARCLAERGVLISDLRGGVSHVAESGTPLYTLTLRMQLPADLELSALEASLDEVATKLTVDIQIKPPAKVT